MFVEHCGSSTQGLHMAVTCHRAACCSPWRSAPSCSCKPARRESSGICSSLPLWSSHSCRCDPWSPAGQRPPSLPGSQFYSFILGISWRAISCWIKCFWIKHFKVQMDHTYWYSSHQSRFQHTGVAFTAFFYLGGLKMKETNSQSIK